MGQRRRLQVGTSFLLAAVVVGLLIFSTPSTAFACDRADAAIGVACGDHVELRDKASVAGHPGSAPSKGVPSGSLISTAPTIPVTDHGECLVRINWMTLPQCQPSPPKPAASGTPAVTISDIATFRPRPGTDHMQPDGWTVAGLDTNFYALAPQQVVGGRLLGRPAEVRFTAVRFHWAYGDGAEADRSTPGGTWEQLRIAEFDPTPTSHVYRIEGEYTIRLLIDFGAEYRFGGTTWTPIDGAVTVAANDLRIAVGDAKTVLVDRDCGGDPRGPGC